jgi:hypothetical protein
MECARPDRGAESITWASFDRIIPVAEPGEGASETTKVQIPRILGHQALRRYRWLLHYRPICPHAKAKGIAAVRADASEKIT